MKIKLSLAIVSGLLTLPPTPARAWTGPGPTDVADFCFAASNEPVHCDVPNVAYYVKRIDVAHAAAAQEAAAAQAAAATQVASDAADQAQSPDQKIYATRPGETLPPPPPKKPHEFTVGVLLGGTTLMGDSFYGSDSDPTAPGLGAAYAGARFQLKNVVFDFMGEKYNYGSGWQARAGYTIPLYVNGFRFLAGYGERDRLVWMTDKEKFATFSAEIIMRRNEHAGFAIGGGWDRSLNVPTNLASVEDSDKPGYRNTARLYATIDFNIFGKNKIK